MKGICIYLRLSIHAELAGTVQLRQLALLTAKPDGSACGMNTIRPDRQQPRVVPTLPEMTANPDSWHAVVRATLFPYLSRRCTVAQLHCRTNLHLPVFTRITP
jgi:hypothetical protein